MVLTGSVDCGACSVPGEDEARAVSGGATLSTCASVSPGATGLGAIGLGN